MDHMHNPWGEGIHKDPWEVPEEVEVAAGIQIVQVSDNLVRHTQTLHGDGYRDQRRPVVVGLALPAVLAWFLASGQMNSLF